MLELKKKALSGIKEMLDGRIADKMKPKKPEVEIEISSEEVPGGGEGGEEGTEIHEGSQSEGQPNIEALNPEEQQQLEALLNKMGC